MNLVSTPGNPIPGDAVTGVIQTPDGVALRFARWDSLADAAGDAKGDANGDIKGTVCVFTGRSEFIEKYFETVRELRQRGFAVATMDWRGQGHSSRQLPDPRKGHVADFQDFEIDLEAFMQRVVVPHCPPPYYALAHSMGGAVLLRAAHSGKRWFERMVLAAPLIDLPYPRTSWPLRVAMRVLRLAGFGESYVPGSNVDRVRASGFPGNPLTSDPGRYARNAALLEQDPTLGIGSPTVDWLDAAFETVVEFRAADYPSHIGQPVLLVAAGADTVVSAAAIASFAARLPAGSLLTIEGARHEILQEADLYRAQFWAAFDAFVPGAAVRQPRRPSRERQFRAVRGHNASCGQAAPSMVSPIREIAGRAIHGRRRDRGAMGSQIAVPLWVVIIVAVLAALAVIDRILMPSVRWALRRRANRAIDELNTRLKLRIQPFKLTKRQVLIDRLVFDPEVLHAADEYAREAGVPREVAMEKVKRYAQEIVPSFSAYAYFRVGTRIARSISQMLYRVRIGYRNDDALAKVDPGIVGHLRHQPSLQYGLRAGDLCRGDLLGAELCRRRMGAGLGPARPDPVDGRLFHQPGFPRGALSQGAGALCPHGDGGGRHPGDLSGRRPQP